MTEHELNEIGYAQELKRGMGWFSNFAISFSIISILAGGMTSYWLGMVTGGPRVIMLGWIIVGFFALLVGMAMGEICSAYPTAGGLYYWSAKLARKNGARWAWFTGWFNLLGQIGVIAWVDYALSIFIAYFIRMFDDGFKLTVWTIFVIFLLVLVAHGLLNTFGVKLVKILGDISVWWHVVGVVIIFLRSDDRSETTSAASARCLRQRAARAHRLDRRGASWRSTCSGSGCCWPSTRSPGSTRRRTSARRPSAPAPRRRRRSCGRSTCRRSPRSS